LQVFFESQPVCVWPNSGFWCCVSLPLQITPLPGMALVTHNMGGYECKKQQSEKKKQKQANWEEKFADILLYWLQWQLWGREGCEFLLSLEKSRAFNGCIAHAFWLGNHEGGGFVIKNIHPWHGWVKTIFGNQCPLPGLEFGHNHP